MFHIRTRSLTPHHHTLLPPTHNRLRYTLSGLHNHETGLLRPHVIVQISPSTRFFFFFFSFDCSLCRALNHSRLFGGHFARSSPLITTTISIIITTIRTIIVIAIVCLSSVRSIVFDYEQYRCLISISFSLKYHKHSYLITFTFNWTIFFPLLGFAFNVLFVCVFFYLASLCPDQITL